MNGVRDVVRALGHDTVFDVHDGDRQVAGVGGNVDATSHVPNLAFLEVLGALSRVQDLRVFEDLRDGLEARLGQNFVQPLRIGNVLVGAVVRQAELGLYLVVESQRVFHETFHFVGTDHRSIDELDQVFAATEADFQICDCVLDCDFETRCDCLRHD